MSKIKTFIAVWEHEHQITLKVLRALPEAQFHFKAHDNFFSAGELAWHLVKIEDYFGRGIFLEKIVLNPNRPAPPKTVAEIIAYAEREHPLIVAAWQTLDDEALRHKIPFARPDGKVLMELPRMAFLQTAMMSHVIHHRGQLALMLKMMGAKVPSIYGPSGDESV